MHSAQALVAEGVGVALVPELDHRHDVGVVHLAISGARVGRSIFAASSTVAGTGTATRDMLDALAGAARAIWPELVASRPPAGDVAHLSAHNLARC
jgi:DNA-binding transcriptional LysR family regulator